LFKPGAEGTTQLGIMKSTTRTVRGVGRTTDVRVPNFENRSLSHSDTLMLSPVCLAILAWREGSKTSTVLLVGLRSPCDV